MNRVALPNGNVAPALGLGTWRMGEQPQKRKEESAAVRSAIELGYRLFDTAEMYGEGGAEAVSGGALHGALRSGDLRREEAFVVSKVYPHNASRRGVVTACERRLRRLRLESIDLYQLHWPDPNPLDDTVAGFEALQQRGLIGGWGVSNFDTNDMKRLWRVGGAAPAQ